MNKFTPCLTLWKYIKARLHQVFNSLYIMIGAVFVFLHFGGIFQTQSGSQFIQYAQYLCVQILKFANAIFRSQSFEPECFNPNPLTDQSVLAEYRTQLNSLVCVTSINGRNGGE